MSLSERIKNARKNANLTQQVLADLIGVAKSTVAGYEKGDREPDALKLKLIAKHTGVTGGYLLEIDDSSPKKPILSPEAMKLARMYDSLDPHSKRIVYTVATMESERKPEPALPKGIMPMSAMPFHSIPNIGTLNCTGELETKYAARQELAELESSPDITPVE